MKKATLILGLIIYSLFIFSQKSEKILNPDGIKYPVYLSQDQIVSNKDYPSALKDSITLLNRKLTSKDAIDIVRNSLVMNDTSENYPVKLDSILDIGLRIYLKVVVNDGVVDTKTEKTVNGTKTTTTSAYHFEFRPITVPFSEFKFIRIKTVDDYYALDCVTKVTTFKSDYYGANKFVFKIKPNANEISLIASVLYLCKDIKNGGFINY